MSEAGSPDQAWRVAGAGLCGLALALGVGRFAYTPLLPMMQADQGMSLQTGSWLALVNMLGYLIGGLSGKYLTDHPVRYARLSFLCIAVSLFGMALTSNAVLWGFWRLVAGVGSAWMMIMVSIVTLPRLVGSPRLPGFVYSGVGSGIVLAGTLCALFVLLGLTSGAAWLALGAASILLGIPLWRVFRSAWDQPIDASPVKRSTDRESSQPVDESRLWLLVVCYGLYGFGYILPATYLPAQARLLLEESWTYSLAWPVFGLAAALSTLVASIVAARLGLLKTWLLAQILLLIGVLTPIVLGNMAGVLFASLCVGGTFVVITLVAMQEANKRAKAQSGVWMARLTAAFALGQVLGPAAIVLLRGRLEPGLWLAAAALLVSAVALGWQARQDSVASAR